MSGHKAIQPDNTVLREIFARDIIYKKYLKGLMLVHDTAAPVSSVHGPARLDDRDRQELWHDTIHELEQLSHPVEKNLLANYKVAKDLRHRFEHTEFDYADNPEYLREVDNFLDDIVQIYTRVTHIKHGDATK